MRTLVVLAFLGLSGPLVVPAHAAAYTWVGLGSNDSWTNTNGNWEGTSHYPGYQPGFQDDTAYFGPATQSYNTYLQSGIVVLSSITYDAPGYSLLVNGSLITTTGISATTANAPNVTANFFLGLGGTSTIGNLTGAGQLLDYGPATLNIVGPSSTFSGGIQGNISVAVGDGAQAASLTLNRSDDIPNTYTGTTRVNANATLVAGTAGALGESSAHVIDGALSLVSGSNTIAALSGAGTVELGANALTIAGGGTFDGTLSGTGGTLIKQGAGTLTLTGNSTYNGTTMVGDGVLIVDGSIASDVTVLDGATFGGDGVVAGDITLESGATLVTVDCFDATTLVWNAEAKLVFSLNDGFSDILELTGNLDKVGAGNFGIEFVDADWQVGQTYTLIVFGETDFVGGDFSFTNVGGFAGTFAIDEINSSLEFTLTAVPEPGTMSLLTCGALVLAMRRRR